MNRRDFLRPRRLAHAAGSVLGPLAALAEPPATPPGPLALIRCARRAMATTFEVIQPFGRPFAAEAAESALDLIDALEAQMTVYRDDSEVSRLNRTAATAPVAVEPRLFDLFRGCARWTAATGGAFDVTAGPLVKAWGFFRRQGRVPSDAELADALARVGMRHVELVADRRSVRFSRPGVEINLGAVGKGYALDRAGERLRDHWGVSAALVHGGGSSVLAVGTEPGDRRGWAVGVKHPRDPGRRVAVVHVRDAALGTSADTHQRFEYNGRTFGHLLDPRTGRPASGVASATVVAPTAAEADALSTAFYILGVEAAREYCRHHPAVGAVILPDGDGAGPVAVNLPPDSLNLSPAGIGRRA